MKSKNLENKFSKQSIQNKCNQKKNRKSTKPKKTYKQYHGQQNDTQSEHNNFSQKKQKKYINFQTNKRSDHLKKSSKMRCSITEQSNTSNNQQITNKINKSKTLKISQKRHSQNFIGQLNSYLHQLKRNKLNLNQMSKYNDISKSKALQIPLKSNKNKKQQNLNQYQNTLVIVNSDRLQKKIKKQKTINLNLQKCIIEIQKVLWQRNQKLQELQQELHRNSKSKLNYSKKINQLNTNNFSKTIFFNRDLGSKSQQISKNKKNIIFKEQSQPQQQSSINQVSKISLRKNVKHQSADNYSQKQQKKIDLLRFKQRKIGDSIRFKEKQEQFTKLKQKMNKKSQRLNINDNIFSMNSQHMKQYQHNRRQKSFNKLQKHHKFF